MVARRPVLSAPVAVWLMAAFIAPISARPAAHAAGHPTEETASALYMRGQYVLAAEQAREALDRDPEDARAAAVWVDALARLNRTQEAEALLDRDTSSPVPKPTARMISGRLAYLRGDVAAAESLFAIALRFHREQGDAGGEMVAREQLGQVLMRLGRAQEAAAQFEAALALAESLAAPVTRAALHWQLGEALKEVSRRQTGTLVADAVAHLELAIDQARAGDWPGVEAEAQLCLSIITRWRGDLDRTLALREAALSGFERIGHLPAQADCLQRIAAIHGPRGNLTAAAQALYRAWPLARESGNGRLLSVVILSLGDLSLSVGDHARALELYREAHQAARQVNAADHVGLSLTGMATVLADEDRYKEALDLFNQALAVFRQNQDRRMEIIALAGLGRCCALMADLPAAIMALERAASLGAEMGSTDATYASVLLALADCLQQQGERRKARAMLQRAEALGQAMNIPWIIAGTREVKARAAQQQGRPSEALGLLQEAMAIREGLRARLAGTPELQAGLFGAGSTTYAQAVGLLYDMHVQDPSGGHDLRAFEIVQRAKARTTLDLLAEARVDLRSRSGAPYQSREAEIYAQIGKLMEREAAPGAGDSLLAAAEMARLEGELQLLERDLRAADPRYAEIRYPRPLSLAEVQCEVLSAEEVLVEYLLGREASYVWIVTPQSFAFHRLPPRDGIERAVRAYLPLLADYNLAGSDPAYLLPPAVETSRHLLGPWKNLRLRNRKLVIVPDGILSYLPFEALLWVDDGDQETARSYNELPFLVRVADVTYAPSLGTLAQLREGGAASQDADLVPPQSILIFGDPPARSGAEASVFAQVTLGRDVPAVPYAAAEIQGLRALFRPGDVRVITGAGATVAALSRAVEAGRLGFLHVAAHGVFNERRPQYSGLLLAPDKASADDGFLTVGEVFGLDLHCNLVTLSSCSSALGREVAGEGVEGLVRAFLYAGAGGVVAALWDVAGRETTSLMQSFYQQMIQDPTSGYSHALAETKRRMIRGPLSPPQRSDPDRAHPFFWAGFVLTGDGR